MQPLQARADIRKEIQLVARREEDLEGSLRDALVVSALARVLGQGGNPQVGHVMCVVWLARSKLHARGAHVFQCEPLGDARTVLAQPLYPVLFGTRDHRIDIPQGIIEIESDGTELVPGDDHMLEFHLIIGNRKYSSWSLRPWMLMTHLGVRFRETIVPLDTPEFKDQIFRYSRAGRVPVLRHGELTVWDSLAICEYVAEVTGRGLPPSREARAVARSAAAEMHSGFATLREEWPLSATARNRHTAMTPGLEADIRRIDELWSQCKARF